MIGKVLIQADLDYSYSPWKYHGDEQMVEITLDVSQSLFIPMLLQVSVPLMALFYSNMLTKEKLRSFKSREHINEEGDGPYHGFDYSSLVSDPLDLATWSQGELLKFCNFQQSCRYKD